MGPGLANDYYDACSGYFYTYGARPRYFEFSESLHQKKAAGLLTKLVDGKPLVTG